MFSKRTARVIYICILIQVCGSCLDIYIYILRGRTVYLSGSSVSTVERVFKGFSVSRSAGGIYHHFYHGQDSGRPDRYDDSSVLGDGSSKNATIYI